MSDRELLTLIPVFDAIMSEGNLSRAAERLGVTQPAVSQALARLRKLTSDPLFENHGRGVRPTPRALEIAGHARAVLTHANAAFTPKTLDIGNLERTFAFDIGGGFDALLLPILYKVLAQKAPGVSCVVRNTRSSDLLTELRYGETELAVDFQPMEAEGVRCVRLGDDTAVVLARSDHPALPHGLTMRLYLELPHAALVWSRSLASSGVALELERLGMKVRHAISVPTITAVGALVAQSDLIATVSRFAARALYSLYRLERHPLPFRMPPLGLYLLWHERFDDDAGHRWLRDTILGLRAEALQK
ncbi:MAG: LysR family transcriptional regulator [Hyphomonadaceae bacterium]|jgi:LysR family transcriptional activator for leuABCD operon|nr:LysR family transcriptional regulator [Hyphomonadaceae bacterium]